ncbi:MAG: hypothetical protein KME42_13805 [Tildeniella nuda ZEHNDER 1965/U140]|jgi:uncharacterized protein YdbL (DUF1318 family)|nr:hypothetical protein [Tildeniella nuda ZEHNDER 1965/U140]
MLQFTAHIYLHDTGSWRYGYLLPVQNEAEAQALAEAIALCHGADVKRPDKAVYALHKHQKVAA